MTTLTELARLGFAELAASNECIAELDYEHLLPLFGAVADPDQALHFLVRLRESFPEELSVTLADEAAAGRLLSVLGASEGLG